MNELNRVRTLPWIRDNATYEVYKENLARYTTEYEFFKVKNPSPELMEKKASEVEKDSDAYVSLMNRARLIKNGEYGTALEKNIAAYVLAIAEYEAKQAGITPIDIGKGLINKDPKVMKILQDRFLKTRAEREGSLGAEIINLGLQSKEDVIQEIFEEYDFINIEKPELSLVPVTESPSKVVETVQGVLEQYLETAGISKEINEYRSARASGEARFQRASEKVQSVSITEKTEKKEQTKEREE